MIVVGLSLLLFLLAATGLSLGLLFGRGGIRGSCRAMADAPGADSHCACSEPCPRRRRALERAARRSEDLQT